MKRITYNYTFEDSEFGTIYIREKQRVTHIIFNIVNNSVVISVPLGYKEKHIRPYLDQARNSIRKMFQRSQIKKDERFIDRDFRISTFKYEFSIECNRQEGYQLSENPKFNNSPCRNADTVNDLQKYSVVLYCPADLDFKVESRQKWLESVIVNTIQNMARPYLYSQLKEMSRLSGLQFEDYGVGHAQTRWGACRSDRKRTKKTMSRSSAIVDLGTFSKEEYKAHKIMLSAYTALLPEHLTKYIILHELSHTRHPDHSSDFHATVNRLTQAILGLTEDECEKQMKAYSTSIFSFADKK